MSFQSNLACDPKGAAHSIAAAQNSMAVTVETLILFASGVWSA